MYGLSEHHFSSSVIKHQTVRKSQGSGDFGFGIVNSMQRLKITLKLFQASFCNIFQTSKDFYILKYFWLEIPHLNIKWVARGCPNAAMYKISTSQNE